jgi:Zn-dependent protease with chaperone function
MARFFLKYFGYTIPVDRSPLDLELNTPANIDQEIANNSRETIQLLTQLSLPLLLSLAVLVLAFLIYRSHPARIQRRKKLTPFGPNRDPNFHHEIQQLCVVAGISPVPTVMMSQEIKGQNGQAFGLRHRYILGLRGGMRLALVKAPDSFRAIVLHELAHIANGDVGRTYFAQALWVAVILLALVPLILFFTGTAILEPIRGVFREGVGGFNWLQWLIVSIREFLLVILQVAITLAVVAAIRSSLLRVREIYADWRAATWGAGSHLSKIFSQARSSDRLSLWERIWGLHPMPQERQALLSDPTGLFQIKLDLPILVGLLLAIVLDSISPLGGSALPIFGILLNTGHIMWLRLVQMTVAFGGPVLDFLVVEVGHPVLINLIPFGTMFVLYFAVAYLVAGTLGIQIQRESVVALTTQSGGCGRYMHLLRIAVLVAAGVTIGFIVSPISVSAPVVFAIGGGPARGLLNVLIIFAWSIGVAVVTWRWLVYAYYFSQLLLGQHRGSSPPQGSLRLLTFALSSLLVVLYAPLIVAQILIAGFVLGESGIPFHILPIALGIAVILYPVVFGATWAIIRVRRVIITPRCPNCGEVTHHEVAVGQKCEHCGEDLALWLFVPHLMVSEELLAT